ncbi:uncharacterized protein SCHCODRAFT_02604577 [Schizophyllum commune H4-8]|uniref:uncharacterized protein n=1 Tax=Schizophyllum commune (strain H4-8 / FGSC 9210) TaxID=578458 RepID=UPI0021605472|nr:uncharacterized protein SCHCODRAFT_02604577 [Schizophyllum commune H4-8]KAI5899241.1 hypothetical protein SCHCODRAFT_02604577 [Schizophyllum commune H4-8]
MFESRHVLLAVAGVHLPRLCSRPKRRHSRHCQALDAQSRCVVPNPDADSLMPNLDFVSPFRDFLSRRVLNRVRETHRATGASTFNLSGDPAQARAIRGNFCARDEEDFCDAKVGGPKRTDRTYEWGGRRRHEKIPEIFWEGASWGSAISGGDFRPPLSGRGVSPAG